MALVSTIYHRANADAPTGQDAEDRNRAAFAEAWRSRGLLVVYPDQITDEWSRQFAVNLANSLYGSHK